MPDESAESAERSGQWYLCGFTDLALKERLLPDPDLLAGTRRARRRGSTTRSPHAGSVTTCAAIAGSNRRSCAPSRPRSTGP